MFSDPAAPTNSAPSPPTSPSRFGRGLSYLRNYTHHLHSRSESDQSAPITNTTTVLAENTLQHPTALTPPTVDSSTSQPPSAGTTALPTTSGSGTWLLSQQGPISTLTAAASGRAQITSEPSQTILQTPEAMTRNSTATADRPSGPVSIIPPPTQNASPNQQLPSIRFIPHHDPRTHRPSLTFQAISRTLPTAEAVIRVGRYSERDGSTEVKSNLPSAAPVGFKSKVVSRRHCEFWCENSQWYIRDVKSSSGTFLNHLRLSPPGVESKAYPVNDGDVVQLGIDFRGGEEMIFRCVKIRIECNRGWQKGLNPFK
jgi:pSer/pThr/pTyr-binding forkhead associated (FHA) protein